MLPNFLGIGVHKCGTTALHHLLASHPQVYMPDRRKEICYFSTRYDNGQGWYESFFPEAPGPYKAIGEFSPQYFFKKKAVERIVAAGSIERLIVSLRDPAERLYSHYWMTVRDRQHGETFEHFIRHNAGRAMDAGRYATHLKRYLRYFRKDQILVLIYEDTFANPVALKHTLADFLAIDPALFPTGAAERRVNQRSIRRFGAAYKLARRAGYALRRRFDMDGLVNRTRDVLMGRLFTSKALPENQLREPMSAEVRAVIQAYYADEVAELQRIFDLDLHTWPTYRDSLKTF